MYKIDLHTHSILSQDGGLTSTDLEHIFAKKILDQIAITDHNEVAYAIELNKKWGDKVIVGEEIMTKSGEVIGLFLQKKIPANLDLVWTLKEIKAQNALVYIPHPFQIVNGLKEDAMLEIVESIDIIEAYNSRAIFQKTNHKALLFAQKHNKIGAVGSDGHGKHGIGKTYNLINNIATGDTLLEELAKCTHIRSRIGIRGFLEPAINRLKKIFK